MQAQSCKLGRKVHLGSSECKVEPAPRSVAEGPVLRPDHKHQGLAADAHLRPPSACQELLMVVLWVVL